MKAAIDAYEEEWSGTETTGETDLTPATAYGMAGLLPLAVASGNMSQLVPLQSARPFDMATRMAPAMAVSPAGFLSPNMMFP